MKNIDKVMSLILFITVLIIIITIWKTANENPLPDNNKEYVEDYFFETPLKMVSINYRNPIKGDLIVRKENDYVGKKVSLGEFDFYIRGNVTNVTYTFEFTKEFIEKNDINPETIYLYTTIEDELVKAGGLRDNNTIILTTKKLVPITILAEPNEIEELDIEKAFYNSRSEASIFYEKILNIMKDKKKTLILGFVGIGIMMTLLLLTIEKNRLPKKKASDKNIREYVQHVRIEGLSDEEIIANLIERGIKPLHAEMLVKKK